MPLNWSVTYKDKSVHQYTEKNKKNFNISHIDYKKLNLIQLKLPNAVAPLFTLHFDDPDKRPIFVMRNQLPSAKMPFHIRCYIIGWQMNVNGKNIQAVNYVFETIGRKIMVDHPLKQGEKVEVIQEQYWIESAGKFDKDRDAWFVSPSAKQLAVIGSNVQGN